MKTKYNVRTLRQIEEEVENGLTVNMIIHHTYLPLRKNDNSRKKKSRDWFDPFKEELLS